MFNWFVLGTQIHPLKVLFETQCSAQLAQRTGISPLFTFHYQLDLHTGPLYVILFEYRAKGIFKKIIGREEGEITWVFEYISFASEKHKWDPN